MKGVKSLLTAILVLSVLSAFSQENSLPKSFKELFSDAEYYFQYGDYREALTLYTQAQKLEPANHNINYRIGVCLLNIPGQKEKALAYLEYASNKISETYQEGSYKETSAPPIISLYLGDAYRIKEETDKAIAAYTAFKQQLNVKDVYNHDFVDQQIKACEKAKIFIAKPAKTTNDIIDFDFPNLDLAYAPVISEDGNTLFFTQHKKFYEALYWCKKVDGKWGTPESINIPLGLDGEISVSSCNTDGSEVFIFVNDHGNGDIYHSTYSKGWSKATKLNKNINSPYWETNAAISKDGKTLYFSSNRKGGFGGIDIYRSHKDAKGEWGPAENLGTTINTPYNEEAPFICEDKEMLFFASQGHENMGGYDIYFSKVNVNGFSSPINLGYPINTTDDDIYFCPLCGNGIKGIVFKRKNTTKAITQLVEIGLIPQSDLAQISGSILSQDKAELSNTNIKLFAIDKATGDSIVPKLDETGINFTFEVRSGSYTLVAEADGYQTSKQDIFVPQEVAGSNLPFTFFLIPNDVISGEYLTIRSIQFGFDSYVLTRDAQVELEKVFNIMQAYPSVLVEIAGHTDTKGASAYNKSLSMKRAQAAVDFLSAKGIEPSRLVTRGVGAEESIAINNNPDGSDNPMGRRFNRRASIKILKSDKAIIIAEDVSIPENLKATKESFFTILLCQQKSQPDLAFFQALPILKDQPIKIHNTATGYLVTVGEFGNKGEAIKLMNQCIEGGYASANIISDVLLASFKAKDTALAENLSVSNTEKKYTIQLLASKKKLPIKTFKGLKEVKEFLGKDNLYRYVFGEYSDKDEATLDLKQKVTPIYPDAFVTSMSRVK